MIQVVLDTNVIVSGVISAKGPAYEILKAWEEKKIVLLMTQPILEEIQEVLLRPKIRKRHQMTLEEIGDFCAQIEAFSVLIKPPEKSAKVSIDPDDIMFLDCALSGDAEFIVTGDKELLSLEKFGDTTILTPAKFLSVLKSH